MGDMNARSFALFDYRTIVWGTCIIVSAIILWMNCSAGLTTGYIGGICQHGLGLVDIVLLIFAAPLYMIMLLVMAGLLNGGIKFW
jgi:hypothetical protein